MTTERWTDDMLDRLVGSVASLAELSDQNTRSISRLEASVESLVNVAQQHQQNFEMIFVELQRQGTDVREMQADVREMQAEVRGLQTENRRILDQLINREGDND
jgi:methyl-accepting chemotaxis protein